MNLQTIFTELSHGELSQVVLGQGGEHEEGVPTAKRRGMAAHVQGALTRLHSRFDLSKLRTQITPVEGQTVYLIDDAKLLKIVDVFDADGNTINLNNTSVVEGVTTPTYNTLSIPESSDVGPLTVSYRIDHEPLDMGTAVTAPQAVLINVSPVFTYPIALFVASRMTTPMGASATGYAEGDTYMARFDQVCAELKMNGFEMGHSSENTRFEANGWR